MTPQLFALSALQRYRIIETKDTVRLIEHGGGELCYYDAVEKMVVAWPTQAQGEAVAWVAKLKCDARPRESSDPQWFISNEEINVREDVAFEGKDRYNIFQVFTHPSPSTAALREALRDLLQVLDSSAKIRKGDFYNERKRASKLLAGEGT